MKKLLLLLLLFGATSGFALTCTLNNGTNLNWNVSTNWTCNRVPISGDTTVINGTNSAIVTDAESAFSVTVSSTATIGLDIQSGGTLTNASDAAGNFVISGGANVTVEAGGELISGNDGTAATAGVMQITGANTVLYCKGTCVMQNNWVTKNQGRFRLACGGQFNDNITASTQIYTFILSNAGTTSPFAGFQADTCGWGTAVLNTPDTSLCGDTVTPGPACINTTGAGAGSVANIKFNNSGADGVFISKGGLIFQHCGFNNASGQGTNTCLQTDQIDLEGALYDGVGTGAGTPVVNGSTLWCEPRDTNGMCIFKNNSLFQIGRSNAGGDAVDMDWELGGSCTSLTNCVFDNNSVMAGGAGVMINSRVLFQNSKFWSPHQTVVLNSQIYDYNGCMEQVTTAGTTGGSTVNDYTGMPAWTSTTCSVGSTTPDNTVTWTNEGYPPIFGEASGNFITAQLGANNSAGQNIRVQFHDNLLARLDGPPLGNGTTSTNNLPIQLHGGQGTILQNNVVINPFWSSTCNLQTSQTIDEGSPQWPGASHAYTTANNGVIITDSNNNWQELEIAANGSTGTSAPSWNPTLGGTTTDGTVTWRTFAIAGPNNDDGMIVDNQNPGGCGYNPVYRMGQPSYNRNWIVTNGWGHMSDNVNGTRVNSSFTHYIGYDPSPPNPASGGLRAGWHNEQFCGPNKYPVDIYSVNLDMPIGWNTGTGTGCTSWFQQNEFQCSLTSAAVSSNILTLVYNGCASNTSTTPDRGYTLVLDAMTNANNLWLNKLTLINPLSFSNASGTFTVTYYLPQRFGLTHANYSTATESTGQVYGGSFWDYNVYGPRQGSNSNIAPFPMWNPSTAVYATPQQGWLYYQGSGTLSGQTRFTAQGINSVTSTSATLNTPANLNGTTVGDYAECSNNTSIRVQITAVNTGTGQITYNNPNSNNGATGLPSCTGSNTMTVYIQGSAVPYGQYGFQKFVYQADAQANWNPVAICQTCEITAYDTMLGGPGTVANVQQKLSQMNNWDPGWSYSTQTYGTNNANHPTFVPNPDTGKGRYNIKDIEAYYRRNFVDMNGMYKNFSATEYNDNGIKGVDAGPAGSVYPPLAQAPAQ